MAKRERLGLAVGTAAIAFALACNPASAQPGPRGPSPDNMGWGPGMMMGPGMMGPGGFGFMCNPRAAGFAEWRMQRIESAVRPTEAQRPALNELRTASTKAAETISAACAPDFPTKSTQRFEAMEKRVEAMLQAIRIVRPEPSMGCWTMTRRLA